MVAETGPYLLMAALCERAQQDQYGSFSVINVLENLVAGTDDPNAPEEMPTFRIDANLVVAFASGTARGKETVTIIPVQPDGKRLEPVSQDIELLGGDHRSTIVSTLSIDIVQPGVYWFDVELSGRLVTRIPLRIAYERRGVPSWVREN